MHLLETIINIFFMTALFINAALFIPQTLRIIKTKDATGVSLATFGGFLTIQLIVITHTLWVHDYLSSIGFGLSALTCGSVVLATLTYRGKTSHAK